MQSRQVVCALAGWRLMCEAVLLVLLVLGGGATVSAQVNTATLSGTVFDPQNLAVRRKTNPDQRGHRGNAYRGHRRRRPLQPRGSAPWALRNNRGCRDKFCHLSR